MKDAINKINEQMLIGETENGSSLYKEEYAGAYVEDDKLVVSQTDELKIDEEYEFLEYKTVEYSYNELIEIQDNISKLYVRYIDEFTEETIEKELLQDICGFGIDEYSNKVVVDIVDLNNEKAKIFEQLFGKIECIELNNTEGLNKDSATYKPGRAIYVVTYRKGTAMLVSRCSMGYRAYRKTSANARQYGFVTCGHGIRDSIDNCVYSTSSCNTVIGTIEAYQYAGSVDAAFIEKASNVTISMNIHYDLYGSLIGMDTMRDNAYTGAVQIGTIVYKVGSTTYKTSAKVLNKSYTVVVGDEIFTNMVKIDDLVAAGDSGGIVYTKYDSKCYPAGIIKGHGSNYSVYVKATEIIKYMNVYPY